MADSINHGQGRSRPVCRAKYMIEFFSEYITLVGITQPTIEAQNGKKHSTLDDAIKEHLDSAARKKKIQINIVRACGNVKERIARAARLLHEALHDDKSLQKKNIEAFDTPLWAGFRVPDRVFKDLDLMEPVRAALARLKKNPKNKNVSVQQCLLLPLSPFPSSPGEHFRDDPGRWSLQK